MKTPRESPILIVEDSSTQAFKLQYRLEEAGYPVTAVKSGEAALDYLGANEPALMISDIMMPGIDGYELCRRVKARSSVRPIPVILLTTLSDPQDVLRGIEAGADCFVIKPYRDESLIKRVEHILSVDAGVLPVIPSDDLEFTYNGVRHVIGAERRQIVEFLLSTYECAVEQADELRRLNQALESALAAVKTLKGLIPICASCKKIRDDAGYWRQVEAYISDHSDATFTHGMCPICAEKMFKELEKDKQK